MLEVLQDYPDDVLAISGRGRVTAEDYRAILDREADARLRRHERIRILLVLGPEFDKITAGGALFDLEFGVSHWSRLGRIALVSDLPWMTEAMHLFGLFYHHPVRTFPCAALGEAKAWITAKETAS